MATGAAKAPPYPMGMPPFAVGCNSVFQTLGIQGRALGAVRAALLPETVGNSPQISGSSDCRKTNAQASNAKHFQMGKAISSNSYPDSYWKGRDGWIKSLENDDSGGICKMTINEIWTCESFKSNLYAFASISDAKGESLYTSPGSTLLLDSLLTTSCL